MLLATFLFNLGGYYVFFWALKKQANRELSAKLDDGRYDEHETFEIKIPLSLPYPLQTSDFQRQSGRFVYNQEHYQLVKQKYANDTLTIVAIKDVASSQLTSAMESFTEAGAQPVKDGLNITVKVLLEYVTALYIDISKHNGWSRNIDHTIYLEHPLPIDLSLDSPPPRHS